MSLRGPWDEAGGSWEQGWSREAGGEARSPRTLGLTLPLLPLTRSPSSRTPQQGRDALARRQPRGPPPGGRHGALGPSAMTEEGRPWARTPAPPCPRGLWTATQPLALQGPSGREDGDPLGPALQSPGEGPGRAAPAICAQRLCISGHAELGLGQTYGQVQAWGPCPLSRFFGARPWDYCARPVCREVSPAIFM